jgi:hypothetical protein
MRIVANLTLENDAIKHTLMEALEELVKSNPTIGFWRCYYRLRRKGYECNHKRLYRIYKILSPFCSHRNKA